jgi:hypothetical protein
LAVVVIFTQTDPIVDIALTFTSDKSKLPKGYQLLRRSVGGASLAEMKCGGFPERAA